MATDAQRRLVPPELAVAALVGASTIPLARLIRGGGLGLVIVPALVLPLGLAWSWRRLRLPPTLSFGLSLLGLIWFVSLVHATATLWGPFPSPASLRALADVVSEGNRTITHEVAPIVLTDGIRLFLTAGVWVTAAAIDVAFVRGRSALLAITLAIPMFVIPGTLLESDRRVAEMLLFLSAGAFLLFLDERARTVGWGAIMGRSRPGWRSGPAVRLGTVAVLGAIVLMPILPGYGAPPGLQGLGTGNRVQFNPLVAIKPTLDRTPHRVLFTVNAQRSSYYRLTSLDEFTGEFWQERSGRAEEPFGDARIVPQSPAPSDAVRQEFRIDALAGSWLPAAFEPVSVRAEQEVTLQTDSRALVLNEPLERGMRYTIVSQPPTASERLLNRRVSYDRDALAHYLDLPDDVRADVTQIARDIVGDRTTPFEQTRRLQNYLRTFTYDEKVAAGHTYTNIVDFLTVSRRGYCEQFAGTMAVLARALGIPARVAIGFAGGDSAGNQTYVVTTEFAHAWVEVFFPQAGWVAFEPTPRAGIARVPSYALPDLGRDEPEPDPFDTGAPDPQPTDEPRRPIEDEPASGPTLESGAGAPVWATALAIVAAVVATGWMLVWLRGARVRARIRRAGTTQDAVRARYVDFLAWCSSVGVGKRPGETPVEHARRVGRSLPDASEPMDQLASLVGYALWAPPNGLDPAAVERAASEAQAVIAGSLDVKRRLLAAIGWGRWRAEVR